MRVALWAPESLGWIWAADPADLGSCKSVEVAGKMCDGMFTSHVNAIINICADLKENCVCIHVNLFYTKLTIKRRLFKENKMSELKKVTRK